MISHLYTFFRSAFLHSGLSQSPTRDTPILPFCTHPMLIRLFQYIHDLAPNKVHAAVLASYPGLLTPEFVACKHWGEKVLRDAGRQSRSLLHYSLNLVCTLPVLWKQALQHFLVVSKQFKALPGHASAGWHE